MARWRPQEVSPWRWRGLTIPPDSLRAWVRLGTWEFCMGVFLYVVAGFGTQLIATAPPALSPCSISRTAMPPPSCCPASASPIAPAL